MCAILLLLSFYGSFDDPAYGQNNQPDQILIEPQTPVNLMQLRIENVRTTSRGLEARLFVENSNLTLFLDFDVIAPEGVIEPVSTTSIWHGLGLIPPNGLDILPSDPMLQYDIVFTSPDQSILITSYSLSMKSFVFNALVVGFNWVPLLSVYGPEQIAEGLSKVSNYGSKVLMLGELLDCFDSSVPSFISPMDIDNCVISASKLLDSEPFRILMSEVAFQMGVEISADAIGEVILTLNHLDALSNIADGVANTIILAIGGTLNNQYVLRPGSLDPTLLTPWPPRSLYVTEFLPNTQPRFEWQGVLNSGDYYEVQIDNGSDYSSPIVHVTTTEPFLASPVLLEPGTTYYWRVRAHNSRARDPSAWSDNSFVTGLSDAPDASNVPESSATETAIAVAVNSLFMQTAVAATSTTEFAINNPTLVPTPEPRQDPLYVAQLWVDAAARLDTETVVQYTCQANREAIRNQMIRLGTMLGLGNIFSQAMSQGTLNIDLSRVTFTLVEQSSSLARIHIQGEIATTAGAYYNTTRINRTVPLIFENNMWKLCE